jgi:hypothetical protein
LPCRQAATYSVDMNESVEQNVEEIERELSPSWTSLSAEVRQLAADLKLKAASTHLAADSEHLFQQTSRLCSHIERLHGDVIDLLENVESRLPLPEIANRGNAASSEGVNEEEVVEEKLQIQREMHELRSDYRDIIKALFMWKDDPVERARDNH